MKNVTIMIFIVLALAICAIFLQIYLSRKSGKLPGLILPGICLFYSLIMVFSIVAYQGMTGLDILFMVAYVFFVANIPTIVLLGIYFSCREKNRIKEELDKMNVQDLE